MPKHSNPTDAPNLLAIERMLWARRNYGILTRIAEELGVGVVAVSNVLRGRRRSKRIAAALAKAGAPGFEEDEGSESRDKSNPGVAA